MAWDPTVPNENNLVRTASGDLAKMRGNFEELDPIVVSGLGGLSGVTITSPASGHVVRYNGSVWVNEALNLALLLDVDTSGAVSGQALTYNGSAWVPATPVQTLSGLTDTDVMGAVSGDALTFNGLQWVPSTPVAALGDLTNVDTTGAVSGDALVFDGANWGPSATVGSGLLRAMLVLSGDQSITQDVPTTVTGMQQTVNVGNWAANPASGIIQVPSGVGLIEVRAQATWDTGGAGDQCRLRLLMDGTDVPSGAVQDVRWFSQSTFRTAHNMVSWAIPVSGSEALTLEVTHSESASKSILASAQQTWFEVREASATGGGGGGSSAFTGLAGHVILKLPENQSIPDSTITPVTMSGLVVNSLRGSNSWLVELASGIVEVPSGLGLTHVDIHGVIGWDTSNGGRRTAIIQYETSSGAGFIDPPYLKHVPTAHSAQAAEIRHLIGTHLMPVSGGERFRVSAYHTQGGPINVQASDLTGMEVRGWVLDF